MNTKRILREITTTAITNTQHATQNYEHGRTGQHIFHLTNTASSYQEKNT
jgi:hypothetical protein